MKEKISSVEKLIWSNEDFDQISWHDITIHSIAFAPENYEFLFDIDFILKWINPTALTDNYKFVVAPATLIFENVGNISINMQTLAGECSLQDIERLDGQLSPNKKFTIWKWILQSNEGVLSFAATGFKLFLRRQPILMASQLFTLSERNGISFSRNLE